MKLGAVGIDLVDVTRIANLISRYGDKFVLRILGPDEIAQMGIRRDRAQFVAGRFAAKEAAVKALGQYLVDKPALSRIQVINDETGRPALDLAALNLPQLRHVTAKLSISHERTHAIAIVILTEEK